MSMATSGRSASPRRSHKRVVCDPRTPIASLVPYTEAEDVFVVHEPTVSAADLKGVAGVKLKRGVNLLRILRDSRDQR